MSRENRTTGDDLTDEEKAARDAEIAAARTMTNTELADFSRRGEAAWQKYKNAE